MSYTDSIRSAVQTLTGKDFKMMQADKLIRMLDILAEKEITSDYIDGHLSAMTAAIQEHPDGGRPLHKAWNPLLSVLENHLTKEYKLVPKGHYIGIGIAIGMGLGCAFSVAMMSHNPSFLAIGISLGMSMGVAIGAGMDSSADKKGLAY